MGNIKLPLATMKLSGFMAMWQEANNMNSNFNHCWFPDQWVDGLAFSISISKEIEEIYMVSS